MLHVGHAGTQAVGTLADQPRWKKKFQGWVSLLFDVASEKYE